MPQLKIENYVIDTPLVKILEQLRLLLMNGKLKDIIEKQSELVVTCPNNEHAYGMEKNPDCHINLRDDTSVGYGVFHCFACEEKGSFVQFVALCFNSSYDYAKNWLIRNYGSLASEKVFIGEDIKISNIKQKPKYIDKAILETFQDYCPYLAFRKLSVETCKLLNIKYDPKSKCVIFPCFDNNSNLLMLPTRSTLSKVFYIPHDIEKPVYCLDQINKNNIKTAMITEGLIDAATGWEYGMPTISTLGSPSNEQIIQINKSSITILYLCMDNDEAGYKFTNLLENKLAKRIITINVKLPAGKKDINDLTKEEFKLCIANCSKNNKNNIV